MAGADWSDAENDLIVADYFAMLGQELAGLSYNKAQRNEALRQHLSNRSSKSVEFKHQNISAVLLGFGETWITGYKPASQFQNSLADAVWRWLNRHPEWGKPTRDRSQLAAAVREGGGLWIGPPPTMRNEPPPVHAESLAHLARRYDVAERDARNRELGHAGEALVFEHERAALSAAGREDLSRRVRWVAELDGDGAGYDIESFEPGGGPRLVEVKTTNGWDRTPFHISRNELRVADENRQSWVLIRVWNFAREPRAFSIRPPLETHVELTPTSFLAALR